MLFLGGCDLITNDGLAFVGEIRTLLTLWLRGCTQLSDSGLRHLRGLSSLRGRLRLNFPGAAASLTKAPTPCALRFLVSVVRLNR